jgi:hypothetical protein
MREAVAQAASAWAMRVLIRGDAVYAPAIAPPTKAAKMPDAHHHKAPAVLALNGAALTVGTSTAISPTPRPSIVRRTCTISDATTPAMTAGQVQIPVAGRVFEGAMSGSLAAKFKALINVDLAELVPKEAIFAQDVLPIR